MFTHCPVDLIDAQQAISPTASYYRAALALEADSWSRATAPPLNVDFVPLMSVCSYDNPTWHHTGKEFGALVSAFAEADMGALIARSDGARKGAPS